MASVGGEGGAHGTVSRRFVEENVKQTQLGGKGGAGGSRIGGRERLGVERSQFAQCEESAAQEEERDAAAGEMEVILLVREMSKVCPTLPTLKCARRERWRWI